MTAVVQSGYGNPEDVLRIATIPRPSPGPGEVLVRVRATSVNTPDWVTTTGVPRVLRLRFGLRGPPSPVRGSDVAGVVEQVGAGVDDLRPGDEVFGSTWRNGLGHPGTFAEYAVAPADQLARKPEGVSFEDAAAVVMSGLTAWAALTEAAPVAPGAKVLVNGASGGVGTFAIQLARERGAAVTAVCGPTRGELVRSLGAEHVLDYTREDFTRGEARYDVILDNVLNRRPGETVRALAPGGVFLPNSVGNTGGWFAGLPRLAAALTLRWRGFAVRTVECRPTRDALAALAERVRSGALRVVTDRVYPLAEAPRAVAHLLGHHARGKVVIRVP